MSKRSIEKSGMDTKATRMIRVICILAIAFVALQGLPSKAEADGYRPNPNSPLGKGEHPRLHITRENLPNLREKIKTYYLHEYQTFINWVDEQYHQESNSAAGLMVDFHAFISLVGPIPGIHYPSSRTPADYGNRAIELMLTRVSQPLEYQNEGYYWSDEYAKIARAYDWMWPQLTQEERLVVANWLADAGLLASGPAQGIDNNGEIKNLWSSSYFGASYPWYYGLAIYGDGIRDQDAQMLVNLFKKRMLNGGWLDAQNWVARENGGVSEIGAYGLFHAIKHVMNIDGWRTATGEDYFIQGTKVADAGMLQYYPNFLLYRIAPHGRSNPEYPDGYEWMAIKLGEMSSYQHLDIGGFTSSRVRQLLTVLGTPLNATNPNMASLNRWLLEHRAGDQFAYAYQNFLHFLWGDRSAAAKSPSELGLPRSQFFKGLGMAVMRTGFEDVNDTVIVVLAPPYQLGGHSWLDASGIPQGFTLDKYGPLILRQQAFYRSLTRNNRNNAMRFSDPSTTADGGFAAIINSGTNVLDFYPGSRYDLVGMKRVQFKENQDYLFMEYTKYYMPERVTSYTRQFVYFKPETNIQSDYIVIFDRTETTRPEIIKRWEINMAYDPVINGEEIQIREGKWEYQQADQITISNNVAADPYSGIDNEGHGRVFVRTLLPLQVKMVKVGGPGHEFEMDNGQILDHKSAETDLFYLNRAGAYFTGTYYVDVIPTANNTQENFLHILQTADANLIHQMTPVLLVDGETMVGAHIQDDLQGHKLAMFSKAEQLQTQASYVITASLPVEHLIADLKPGLYRILHDGQNINQDPIPVNEHSVLCFTSHAGGSFSITRLGDLPHLKGDLNLDGIVDEKDVHVAALAVLGLWADEDMQNRADLNQDGRIDVLDLQEIINLCKGD